MTAAAERANRAILPVDSEHSALWQCLGDAPAETVESLVITASGGPFRGLTAADLAAVTPDQALAHPTWSMGSKITIDSATLMNKGLEVIEAHFLFGVPYERIEVAVHPQSIVHAMVRFRDGALLAHLGLPDMRVPISSAPTYPERAEAPAPRLDLASLTLEFEPPDPGVFRCLALARTAGEAGGTAPCARTPRMRWRWASWPAACRSRHRRRGRTGARADRRRARGVGRAGAGHRPAGAADGRRRGDGGGVSYFVAIAGLLILILVHEAGHFLAAKAVGMRAIRFSIGFPPLIARRQIGDTEYALAPSRWAATSRSQA